MKSQKKNMRALKSVIWLVISAFLLVTVMPAHFHLHHELEVDPSVHVHSVELHFALDKSANDHHDEGTSSFEATQDGTVKKKSNSLLYLLLISFIFISLLIPHFIKIGWGYLNFKFQQRFYLDSPPLRAPPFH